MLFSLQPFGDGIIDRMKCLLGQVAGEALDEKCPIYCPKE